MKSYELQKAIHNHIRMGYDSHRIVTALAGQVEEAEKDYLQESVERTCEDYPDYDNIQFFMESKVVSDKDGEDDLLYLFNPKRRQVRTIHRSRLSSMISPKLDWNHRRHTCSFVYDPFKPFKVSNVDGEWQYNLYQPPFWAYDYFMSEGRISVSNPGSIPECYVKFFKHLVDGDEDSYNYLLDWLANALQARNYCVLTTIGNQGIGKGVLGDIMKELFGESNFAKTDNKLIEKDFNGQICNKRLTYLNEVRITSIAQENKMKALIDDYIEVEKKGSDARMVKNYSSIYFSSNNLDAVRIPSDDRRYSIIMLTKRKLIEIMDESEIRDMIYNKEKISALAGYLTYRVVDKQRMMKVFKSARTEEVRSFSLNAWQEWFLEEFCPDKSDEQMKLRDVTSCIEDEFGSSVRPGRGALQTLEQYYPEVFEVKKIRDPGNKNKQYWAINFK